MKKQTFKHNLVPYCFKALLSLYHHRLQMLNIFDFDYGSQNIDKDHITNVFTYHAPSVSSIQKQCVKLSDKDFRYCELLVFASILLVSISQSANIHSMTPDSKIKIYFYLTNSLYFSSIEEELFDFNFGVSFSLAGTTKSKRLSKKHIAISSV